MTKVKIIAPVLGMAVDVSDEQAADLHARGMAEYVDADGNPIPEPVPTPPAPEPPPEESPTGG